MTDITTLTENEIAARILFFASETAHLEAELARRQSEQEALALAEYWRAHPELIPLAVGDKLLVTEITLQHVMGNPDKYDVNTVIEVCGIWHDKNLIYAQNPKYRGFTTMIEPQHANTMRKAYLQSVANESEVSG